MAAARLVLAGTIAADTSATTRALFEAAGLGPTQFTPSVVVDGSGQLQDLAASGRWLDQETCELYTLLELPRSTAHVMIADRLLGSLVGWASRRDVPYENRVEAYEQPRRLVARAEAQGVPAKELASGARLMELDPVFCTGRLGG